jgi:hypothetical protein
MSVSHWGGLLATTLSLGLMASSLSEAAIADKDERIVIAPAVGRADGRSRRLRSRLRWSGCPKRSTGCNRASNSLPCRSIWAGLKAFYASNGPALWVTPTGYSALGSLLIKQVPKATAPGMTIPADVQSHLAGAAVAGPDEQAGRH